MNIKLDFNSKNGRQLMMVLNGLLALLIFLAVLMGALNIRPPADHTTLITHHIAIQHNDVEQISDWHLFGQVLTEDSIPKTSLNATLKGVFTSTDAKHARAVISINGGPDKIFTVGGTISPGATLLKVFDTKIYLNNQGRIEQLKMKLQYPTVLK